MTRTFISRGMAALCLVISSITCLSAQQQMRPADPKPDFNALSECKAVTHAAYKNQVCYVDIHRDNLISPPPMTVHPGTRIFVRILNPRPDETLQPTVTFAHIAPPDIGTDVLKNAINPLQTISISSTEHTVFFDLVLGDVCDITGVTFNGPACEKGIGDALEKTQKAIDVANLAVSCFQNFHVLSKIESEEEEKDDSGATVKVKKTTYTCDNTKQISTDNKKDDPASFAKQKALVKDLVDAGAKASTKAKSLANMDVYIAGQPEKNCGKQCSDIYAAEVAHIEHKSASSAAAAAKAPLKAAASAITSMPDKVQDQVYYFDVPSLTTANATITAVENLSKTSTTVGTWTTTPALQWVVFSTGLTFSTLKNRTFAATPQIQNGQTVLDPNGNVVSILTETENGLSVAVPEVAGSVLLPWIGGLGNKCSFGCSLLVTGGIGANLNAKTAEYDTGISVRLGNFMITPAVHWGREASLTDGFVVGQSIGANAPSTLPTANHWSRRKGLVLSYVIPLT